MTVVAVHKFGDDSCQLQFVTYLRLTQKCLKCNQKVPLPPGYDSPEQRCPVYLELQSEELQTKRHCATEGCTHLSACWEVCTVEGWHPQCFFHSNKVRQLDKPHE